MLPSNLENWDSKKWICLALLGNWEGFFFWCYERALKIMISKHHSQLQQTIQKSIHVVSHCDRQSEKNSVGVI